MQFLSRSRRALEGNSLLPSFPSLNPGETTMALSDPDYANQAD